MEILQQILEKIRAYDRILIFRHKRLDGDCVGSTKGLKAILQLTFPEKETVQEWIDKIAAKTSVTVKKA